MGWFNVNMVNAFETASTPQPQMTRAALIWEAHRFLSQLVSAASSQTPIQVSAEALTWLEERDLIEEVIDEFGNLLVEVTERGRQAVLGRRPMTLH